MTGRDDATDAVIASIGVVLGVAPDETDQSEAEELAGAVVDAVWPIIAAEERKQERRDTLNDALEVVSCEVDRLPPIDARIALVELRMKLRGLRDEAES